MKVRKEYNDHRVILFLEGELVGGYARRLQEDLEALLIQGINHFIFDLSKVDSLDSIGVMTLGCLSRMKALSPGSLRDPEVNLIVPPKRDPDADTTWDSSFGRHPHSGKEYNVRVTYRNIPDHVREIFALDQGGKYRKVVDPVRKFDSSNPVARGEPRQPPKASLVPKGGRRDGFSEQEPGTGNKGNNDNHNFHGNITRLANGVEMVS